MEAKQFVTRAAEFETLQSHVERTNDPALRRAMLGELTSKLAGLTRSQNLRFRNR